MCSWAQSGSSLSSRALPGPCLSSRAQSYRWMESQSQTEAQREALRQYYSDHDTLTSIDGMLKIFTVITCGVSSVLHLVGGTCGSAQLSAGGAAVAIAGAVLTTALCAGSTCSLPIKAPLTWLYADLVLSTVSGGMLLVSALLMFFLCHPQAFLDYVHGPIAAVSSALIIISATITYSSVTRRWDEALRPPSAPPSATIELDV